MRWYNIIIYTLLVFAVGWFGRGIYDGLSMSKPITTDTGYTGVTVTPRSVPQAYLDAISGMQLGLKIKPREIVRWETIIKESVTELPPPLLNGEARYHEGKERGGWNLTSLPHGGSITFGTWTIDTTAILARDGSITLLTAEPDITFKVTQAIHASEPWLHITTQAGVMSGKPAGSVGLDAWQHWTVSGSINTTGDYAIMGGWRW